MCEWVLKFSQPQKFFDIKNYAAIKRNEVLDTCYKVDEP